MELAQLLQALAQPSAYPYPVDAVEVRQTHISAVFLAGPFVYKVKKPVNPGFLDFSTLEKRRHFCEEEVRLNRRLAPQVYLGVVPVTASANGVQVEGTRRGRRVGGEDAAPARRRDAARTPRTRRGRRRNWSRRWPAGSPPSTAMPRRMSVSRPSAGSRQSHGSIMDVFDQAVPQVGTTVSRRSSAGPRR